MTDFTIRLADIPIRVSAIYGSTKDFCGDYLTDGTPQITLRIQPEDIDRARKDSRNSDLLEGREPGIYSDSFLETVALHRKAADALFAHNVLLFHGSVVAVDGRCYMFTAKSGTGKTTHAGLWLKNIPGSHIVNGDKPLLLFRDDGVYACGSPWRGKEGWGTNEIIPLAAVCVLERAEDNHIEEISFGEALQSLVNQSHRPPRNSDIGGYIRLIQRLSGVGLYRLGCNMEDEAALVSYRVMASHSAVGQRIMGPDQT